MQSRSHKMLGVQTATSVGSENTAARQLLARLSVRAVLWADDRVKKFVSSFHQIGTKVERKKNNLIIWNSL